MNAPVIEVRCEMNGGSSLMFTDQKVYTAHHEKNSIYVVRDDYGHSRFIIPDELSPFLLISHSWLDQVKQRAVGRFVTLSKRSR